MKKVLAVLTSKVLYGKERSNIEVYHLLKNSGKFDISVIIDEKSEQRLKNALEGLNVVEMNCPDRHDHSKSIVRYMIGLIWANHFISSVIKRIKPDFLFINNEISLYDFNWAINKYCGKIIYRLGDAPAYPRLRFYKFNSKIWKKLAVQRTDTFVCISQYIMNTLKATGRNSPSDKVIYNYPPARFGIECQNFLPADLDGKDSLVFGYIGQIIESKGVKFFIQAAQKMLRSGLNCRFLVAGNLMYDKDFGEKIKSMVASEDANRILLLGEVNDIESFYKSIDVLCVPSIKQEPLGNIIVEAKKYSKPCVIFPSGGMPELITHLWDGYLCEHQTMDALWKGMLWYEENRNKVMEHSLNSHRSIELLKIDRVHFEQQWLQVFDG